MFLLIFLLILSSAWTGYKYAEIKFLQKQLTPVTKYDTLWIPHYFPADTIKEVKIETKIITKNVIDSAEIYSLLDTIKNLYKRLYELEVKQVAVLDTIFPKGDSLYLEYDKVSDVFAPIYLRRATIELPYQIKTIYMPYEKKRSIWYDVGIGAGAFGLGYLIGNVK